MLFLSLGRGPFAGLGTTWAAAGLGCLLAGEMAASSAAGTRLPASCPQPASHTCPIPPSAPAAWWPSWLKASSRPFEGRHWRMLP